MKVCVLQPDYSTSGVDYQNYDPPRDLTRLLPGHTVDHVALNKLTTYKQLKHLARQGYDIFVNLCEGYLEWEIPSIDVIHSLEMLNLPYTGASPLLYDPPKTLMKYVAHTARVRSPAFALVEGIDDVTAVAERLSFPLFVKPAKAGDSLGVDARSLVRNLGELKDKVAATLDEYPELLVEEYIDGREFTVLVVCGADGRGQAEALTPVEFVFGDGPPFKTYAMKTSELHPEANIAVTDPGLSAELRQAALGVFKGFAATSYARLDFRQGPTGELFFLEVNFGCSVFYTGGYEGSADYVLRHDGLGQAGFAERIIAEGIARHRQKQKSHVVKGNSLAGFGIEATRPLGKGDVVFTGEERAHRIVTRGHVARTWNAHDRVLFRQYAYPLSSEVFAIWDDDPLSWAPQNHSCDPNTGYLGLNVVALRPIAKGEELTLDYRSMLNEDSEPFECHCGAASCRVLVTGSAGNSVTSREMARGPDSDR